MLRAVTDVRVHEVGPRDGLQNEPGVVPVAAKLVLLERLAQAGLTSIELTSFVSPKWIPQLADADEVAARFIAQPGVSYAALVPNLAGFERLQRFASRGIDVLAFFVSASETHNRRNVNRGIDAHLEAFQPVLERARGAGLTVRCTVATAWGCPYEGDVPTGAVVALVSRLRALGADEISLGDTVGVATPSRVRATVRAVAGVTPLDDVSLHLHDTMGRALANALAGFEEGVRAFDSALGGLGGCPYAPGASGNVATEDLVDLFEREGVATGIDLDALVAATTWLEDEVLKRPLPGRVYRARRGAAERARAGGAE